MGAYEYQAPRIARDCADLDCNDITDDNCMWWEVESDTCVGTPRIYADMGGSGGACPLDFSADANDKFHALNCFSDTYFGIPPDDNYLCESESPAFVFNVDVAGAGVTCCPDGSCDVNDSNAALNAFSGTSWCSCPSNGICVGGNENGAPCGNAAGCPGGTCDPIDPDVECCEGTTDMCTPSPKGIMGGGSAGLEVRVRPAEQNQVDGNVVVDVFIDDGIEVLQSYQLHMGVSGGTAGQLALIGIEIEDCTDHVFAGMEHWKAFNATTGQMLAGIDELDGVEIGVRRYLATFTYQANQSADGTFVVDALPYDALTPDQRSFIFISSRRTAPISETTPATIPLDVP